MLRVLVLIALTTNAAFLFAGPGLPSAVAQEDAAARARHLFNEGVALAEAERWAEALSAFRRSADLVPRPSTSYNIANALYRLGRPVEALRELDKYQAMPEVLSRPRDRERGVDLRNLLVKAVGHLRVTVEPADAEVFIDGKLTADTGAERDISLNPGSRSITVTHRGYETSSKEIEIEPGGQHAYAIALTPRKQTTAAAKTLLPPSSSIDLQSASSSTAEPTRDDRKPFVKRPGFWVMIGSIAAVGIGVGLTAALVSKNDGSQCGTTQTCATTQGPALSF